MLYPFQGPLRVSFIRGAACLPRKTWVEMSLDPGRQGACATALSWASGLISFNAGRVLYFFR